MRAYALAALALAAPGWRLEQPAPPAGAPFQVALGAPGSLTFWAPNRGLLGVEGNSVVPRGILAWDGVAWHQLSTVCGGPGDTMRIVWAGPAEFWTISEPSRPRQGSGTALCRFKDGAVAASYSTADSSSDPYRQMNAGACVSAEDCWFGGIGSRDPTGTRVGAFHLHWDGTALRTVYNAGSGRGVSDIEASGSGYVESSVLGPRAGDNHTPDPPPLETEPLLLRRLSGGVFADDPFVVGPGAEVLALDGDGSSVWAVGGGAASGPGVTAGGVTEHAPVAAVSSGGGPFRALTLVAPAGAAAAPALSAPAFGPADRFEDVSAVPGGAWAALVPFADRGRTNAKALVARFDPSGTVDVTSLPLSGSGRGAAARVAFSSDTEGWLVTNAGWLFHYTDGTALPVDTAFAGTITTRPNEAAEQFVPDSAPVDDSQLFAPPPVAVETTTVEAPEPKQLKALITGVRKPSLSKTLVLSLSFRVTRRAKVQLVARRRGRVVAKTANQTLKPGRHTLRLRLSRKRWPTSLRFKTKELTIDESQLAPDGGDETVVTTDG